MKVILITDDPDLKSFEGIVGLIRQIESLGVKTIDLVCYSQQNVFFNCRGQASSQRTSISLENILKRKKYELIIVSLKLENLRKLALCKKSIFVLFKKICPNSAVFVFGAKTAVVRLKQFVESGTIRIVYRHGVTKVTREFNQAVIDYIKSTNTHSPR